MIDSQKELVKDIVHEPKAISFRQFPSITAVEEETPKRQTPISSETLWGNKDEFGGSGTPAIILPADPNALLNRLDLLMASTVAGNNGVRNELVNICDELLRQNFIEKNEYKQLRLCI